MTHIHDIPVDAWVIILRYIDRHKLVETFDILFESDIFGIPKEFKIDTFWIVISQARLLDQQLECESDLNSLPMRELFNKLKEYGFNDDMAADLVRKSNGEFSNALSILGWD